MATPTYHLYLDDSGTRFPTRKSVPRRDGLDYFALGGWLIASDGIDAARCAHAALARRYRLSAPLHSNSIRVRKGDFSWLKHEPERASAFLADLERTLCELPGYVVGCVIHRPGYNARYTPQYGENRWDLCKSAYGIVVERAAKLAARLDRRLMVYLEETGRQEDKAIQVYHSTLLAQGMYFNAKNSEKYEPLSVDVFIRTLFPKPYFVKKFHPMAQFSDLVLYPIAKGRYEPAYRTYRALWDAHRIIDTTLSPSDTHHLGIKYYCFDGV